MKNSNPVAVFDVDGTIIPGFIIVSLPKFLVKRKLFNQEKCNDILLLFKKYLSNDVSTATVVRQVPRLFAQGISGKKVKSVENATKKFMKAELSNIQKHTMLVIDRMKKKKLQLIAISGSPSFAIQYLKIIGFHESVGTTFQESNGRFTGKVKLNLVNSNNKYSEFRKKVGKENIDLARSYAFGDTKHDLPILEVIGTPVALNSDHELSKIAKNKGWLIVRNENDSKKIK